VTPWLILTALVLAVAVVLVARAVRPGSGHRRSLAAALPPVEVLGKSEAHCLIEQRPTLHVRFRCGVVRCLECRNPSGGWA
jgi:hypothetical protein